MMRVVRNFYRIFLTVVLICFVPILSAQTLEEARDLYNQGGEATSEGNLEVAIQNFEECVAMCETLYEEDEDVEYEEETDVDDLDIDVPVSYASEGQREYMAMDVEED